MSGLIGQRYTRNTQGADFLKAQWEIGAVFQCFFLPFSPTCHPGYTLKNIPKVDIERWVLSAFKRLCYMLEREKNMDCWSSELRFQRKD